MVQPRMFAYAEASKALFDVFQQTRVGARVDPGAGGRSAPPRPGPRASAKGGGLPSGGPGYPNHQLKGLGGECGFCERPAPALGQPALCETRVIMLAKRRAVPAA